MSDCLSRRSGWRPDRLGWAVACACVAYLLVQVVYVLRLPLVMDELHYAVWVARLADELPYRDVAPPKTVLGHYVQLLPLLLVEGSWRGALAVKLEMALLNAAALAGLGALLVRHFRAGATLLGLLLLVCSSTFLERSSELRVDMLASWLALGGLFLLLNGRVGWAGAASGLALCVSQKAVYFLLAGNVAVLAAPGLRLRERARRAVAFDLAAATPLVGYLVFWALVSSPSAVLHGVFLRHVDIALADSYTIRAQFWGQTAARNPAFWALAGAGLAHVTWRWGRDGLGAVHATILSYAVVVGAGYAWHKQPWPYFIVTIMPLAAVVIVTMLDEVLRGTWSPRRRRVGLVALLVCGVVAPLATRMPAALRRDSGAQRATVELVESGLEPGETYFAGLELIRGREHWPARATPAASERVGEVALERMRWLDGPRLKRMSAWSAGESQQLVERLADAPPALVVVSYRLRALPRAVQAWFAEQYYPLWGNVLAYAPPLSSGPIALRRAGTYVLVAGAGARIDGQTLAPSGRVRLEAGPHQLEAEDTVRLLRVPPGLEGRLDPRFQRPAPLFSEVYTW